MATRLLARWLKQPRFHDGRFGAALLVYLTAQPEYPTHAGWTPEGILHIHLQTLRRGERLNRMLVRYLARALTVPEDNIEIAAGVRGSGKVVCFYALTPGELEERLQQWLHSLETRVW